MPAFEGLLLRQMVMTQKAQAMHVLDVKKGREEVDSRQRLRERWWLGSGGESTGE